MRRDGVLDKETGGRLLIDGDPCYGDHNYCYEHVPSRSWPAAVGDGRHSARRSSRRTGDGGGRRAPATTRTASATRGKGLLRGVTATVDAAAWRHPRDITQVTTSTTSTRSSP
ncbi:hypothetical protein ACFYPB_29090 [Streptomyces olivaceoviridis]|uniref:hypothetical protein n=1 Tax=Streptomyces olivaceoviridis TaxID=1921 RepID=UPI0036BA8721